MTQNYLNNKYITFNLSNNAQSGVFCFFSQKSPIWGIQLTFKLFSHTPLNLSRRDASFKCPYDYILAHNCDDQKVAKLVKTQKFCLERLNQSFLMGFIYSFFI